MNKCGCGCGQRVTHSKNRYLQGHHVRVNNPFKGKHHSEETKDKIRQIREESGANRRASERMKKNNPMYIKHIRDSISGENAYWYGKHRSVKTREKVGIGNKGKILSESTKMLMSEGKIGDKNPMYGISRELSPVWRGGVSFEPYGTDFNDELKSLIRDRDNHICQLCDIPENGRALDVHHIDYSKLNNVPSNLVALCKSCHGLTQSNREHWKEKFGGLT